MALSVALIFQGAHKISLPYAHNKLLSVKQILSNFPNMDKIEKGPKEIFSPDIQKDLLLLEEQEGSVNFKFGVIYMKHGQTTDDEILSNGNLIINCLIFSEYTSLAYKYNYCCIYRVKFCNNFIGLI